MDRTGLVGVDGRYPRNEKGVIQRLALCHAVVVFRYCTVAWTLVFLCLLQEREGEGKEGKGIGEWDHWLRTGLLFLAGRYICGYGWTRGGDGTT